MARTSVSVSAVVRVSIVIVIIGVLLGVILLTGDSLEAGDAGRHSERVASADDTTSLSLLTATPQVIDRSRTEVISYIVQPGDSLFSIADKFKLHPEVMLWANEGTLAYDPERVRPGVTLRILPINGIYYEWKVWDDLAEVAQRYNVRVEDILNWPGNHLDANRPDIQPGTMLILPGGYPTLMSFDNQNR